MLLFNVLAFPADYSATTGIVIHRSAESLFISSEYAPTYVATGALIAAAVIAASYLPARQAASVDPMETLRSG